MMRLLCLLAVLGWAASVPLQSSPPWGDKCGYESCTDAKPGVLNVHIVAHTHDDVGWLKTVDQYYYGIKNYIQKAGVQYILDSVVQELLEDPKRKFIYVETAFFWKWWVRQSSERQDEVRMLVRQGRLQFVGGAWSMNDEAAAHYQSIVDQFTHGLSKLNATFGPCGIPTVGWQIDPFGHSREFASLLATMGYDGLFLGRIDYQDKENRGRDKAMEMLWRGDDDMGNASDIFTSVLYNQYQPPPGFCFDVLCDDEPIVDDPDSPEFNVDQRVKAFISMARMRASVYPTNNVLVTMGDDFNYQDAGMWFRNLDKLIEKMCVVTSPSRVAQGWSGGECGDDLAHSLFCMVNKFVKWVQAQRQYYITNNVLVTMGGDFTYQDAGMWYRNLDKLIQYTNLMAAKDGLDINVFYSTPNCYLKAVKDAGPTLPIKQDDFFPYASDPTAYWTGYFTSRPTTKYFERRGNAQLQTIKQLQILANMEKHYEFIIDEMRATMGVLQHHDAITGTEKQHVTHDYVRMLSQAMEDSVILINQAYNKIAQGDVTKLPVLNFRPCALNESRCEVIQESERFAINIYNSLPWSRTHVVRIPVANEGPHAVKDPEGKDIESVTQPIFKGFLNKSPTTSKYEVVFASTLEPLGFITYYISQQKRTKRNTEKKIKNDYYENITDYWKHIREKSDIEPKNIAEINLNIPDAPNWSNEMVFVNTPKINVDMLKDKKDDVVLGLEQLDSGKLEKGRDGERHRDIEKMSVLNEDEMRMLSDDASVTMMVERFDEDDEITGYKQQTSVDNLGQITHHQDIYTLQHGAKYYPACAGNNLEYKNRSSGAYIFRPNATKPVDLKLLEATNTQNFLGREYYNVLSHNVSYVLRIHDAKYLPYDEIEWSIGPINVDDKIGKEFIITHSVDIRNEGVFYTDSNGRQMIKRIKNKRPQWNVTLSEPVPGNYYPINNEVSIENEDVEYIVLTDRSCGGTSMNEGEIEVMVHRRLLSDDAFGVGEALNEVENGSGIVVRGTHKFLLAPMKYDNGNEVVAVRRVEIEAQYEPVVLFADATKLKYEDWLKMKNRFSGLDHLDKAVNILTLEPWQDGTLLLRLENILSQEIGIKDPDLNRIVDLSKIFSHIRVISAKETLLAANQWIDKHKHWEWKTQREFSRSFNDGYGTNGKVTPNKTGSKLMDNELVVNLGPKQIRTFVIQYEFIGL